MNGKGQEWYAFCGSPKNLPLWVAASVQGGSSETSAEEKEGVGQKWDQKLISPLFLPKTEGAAGISSGYREGRVFLCFFFACCL